MEIPRKLRDRIGEKYRSALTPQADPELLDQIIDEVADALAPPPRAAAPPPPPATPFDVAWMDSFVAHWALGQRIESGPPTGEVEGLLHELVDLRFDQRLSAIRDFIDEQRRYDPDGGPPDGGPPEPGVPPAGPAGLVSDPDGGPPDGGPPEPGVPPAGPGPTGPEAGFLAENPWVLYWFVSLKAPLLLDMIDAHLERRLGELGIERR